LLTEVGVSQFIQRLLVTLLISVGLTLVCATAEESIRKVKTRIQPTYPEFARKMHVSGTVKLQVIVAPDGAVKDSKVVGGHPVLVNSAQEAIKKWRFEPQASETREVIEFKFSSQE
jgi:TonB family protein